uniref:G-protein coupled receptors family 1 profile domain-containing protein n=1 Tax=Scophthalmus maximus TaxID=52904 RepID=A0A8D3CE02_SCOMX
TLPFCLYVLMKGTLLPVSVKAKLISLSVLIMCGNLLVIISIVYFKQLHTPTNYLILSLAVADLLVGVLVLPFSIILIVSTCWYLQDLLCSVKFSFDMLLCSCSILNLCCISVDRFYAVCQPLRYRIKINVRVVGLMILVTWTVSAIIGIVVTFWAPKQGQNSRRCDVFQTKSSTIVGAFFAFYIPAIVIVTIYLKILMVAQKQERSILNTSKSGATVSKMEKKATKTLALVMGVFLMSWTPFFLCVTIHPLIDYTIPSHVIQTFKWLGWSNSMLNPCVYAFFYSWFRSAFRMIITGKIFQGDLSNSKLF